MSISLKLNGLDDISLCSIQATTCSVSSTISCVFSIVVDGSTSTSDLPEELLIEIVVGWFEKSFLIVWIDEPQEVRKRDVHVRSTNFIFSPCLKLFDRDYIERFYSTTNIARAQSNTLLTLRYRFYGLKYLRMLDETRLIHVKHLDILGNFLLFVCK